MSSARRASIVVLVDEDPEPLDRLYREISEALGEVAGEFLFLLQPEHEEMGKALDQVAATGLPVRRLQLGQQVAESVMARVAAEQARHDDLLLLPAQSRVVPDALPLLVRALNAGADVALACREPGPGGAGVSLQARAYRSVVNRISTQSFSDVASGVLAVRRAVLNDLPLHGEFFRFLPVLAVREGFTVREVAVAPHPAYREPRGRPVGSYVRRLVDLLGLYFLVRFTDRPLRFFGLVGAVLGSAGTVVLLLLFVQRIQGTGIANRPLLLLGLLLLVLGIQAVALGLVAEIIVHLGAPRRRTYRLREPAPTPPDPGS